MKQSIYVYKLIDGKIDVFEAESASSSRKKDGSFFPTESLGTHNNLVMIKLKDCVINSSGKGITQYNKRCMWITCLPKIVYRNNMLWLDEFDLYRAAEIFKEYNNEKIMEYNKYISELEDSNKSIDKFINT